MVKELPLWVNVFGRSCTEVHSPCFRCSGSVASGKKNCFLWFLVCHPQGPLDFSSCRLLCVRCSSPRLQSLTNMYGFHVKHGEPDEVCSLLRARGSSRTAEHGNAAGGKALCGCLESGTMNSLFLLPGWQSCWFHRIAWYRCNINTRTYSLWRTHVYFIDVRSLDQSKSCFWVIMHQWYWEETRKFSCKVIAWFKPLAIGHVEHLLHFPFSKII